MDATTDNQRTTLYHGTRADLAPGALICPSDSPDDATSYVSLTPTLDGAIWEAELAVGEGAGRIYRVEPTGQIQDAAGLPDHKPPGRPWASWRTREPLRVLGEVTEWRLFHGTRADLVPGDLIRPGHTVNYGKRLSWVYLTRTLDAAAWGAELAVGPDRSRVYSVEPTGPVEDDPNLTNKRFRGNPTKSFRSRDPLRVVGEVMEWQGHSPEAIQAMKQGLERLKQLGQVTIED